MTVRAVKAQWMIKQDGIWYLTDGGKDALAKYPTSEELRAASAKAYKVWKKARADGAGAEEAEEVPEAEGEPISGLSSFALEDARERARESIFSAYQKA